MPFSNGYEWDCWSANWCNICKHNEDCSLILDAMMGEKPNQWLDLRPGSLNRYDCTEFEDYREKTLND